MKSNTKILPIKPFVVTAVEDVRNHIYVVRGIPVMFDFDLAHYYGIETRVLKQAVRRNRDSFPEDFMFVLSQEEANLLINSGSSQIVIPHGYNIGQSNPFVFTEAGVAMLSAILKSSVAVDIRVNVMRGFVAMHQYLAKNAQVLQRLDRVEENQQEQKVQLHETMAKVDTLFAQMEEKTLPMRLGIYFDGEMFDAYVLVERLIKQAERRIVLVDDYVDAEVLERMRLRKEGVMVDVYVRAIHQTSSMKKSFDIYHQQYPNEHVELHTFEKSHDRWLVVDEQVYHFGASIKDLGKRWFAVERITEQSAEELISKL